MPDSPSTVKFRTPSGRLLILGALVLVAAAFGVVIMVTAEDNTVNLVLGSAVVGIFGLGGGYSVARQLGELTVIRADQDGIRVVKLGLAPWNDVERIGTNPKGELGIRFRRTDALLQTARDAERKREELREHRKLSGGYDVTFSARDLGADAGEAASALRTLQP